MALHDDLDVARLVRVGAGRLVGVLFEELLRGALRRAPVFADERADVEQQVRPGVEQRVEARVVAPDRLVALRVGEHRDEPGAAEIEEPVLDAQRERRAARTR